MTNPKVSEKEIEEWLNDARVGAAEEGTFQKEVKQAIRAAIEERGRLREGIKKWLRRLLIVNADGCCDGETQMFLDELEIYWHNIVGDDFKLDGEEGK